MFRRIFMAMAVCLVPLGIGIGALASGGTASASTPKFDTSTDTVTCGSFYGSVAITPGLTGVGPFTGTSITVKGVLQDCTDGSGTVSGSETGNVPFGGKVSGTLTGTTNDLTALAGCSSVTGTLTASFKAYDYNTLNTPPLESLLYKTSTITPTEFFGTTFVPGAPFGTDNMNTPGFGAFEFGKAATDNGCTADLPPAGTQAFEGTDSSATTSAFGVTSSDIDAILFGEDTSTATPSTTKIDLGIGSAYFG